MVVIFISSQKIFDVFLFLTAKSKKQKIISFWKIFLAILDR